MTFKITISRPPMAIEFEAGSVSEAVNILQQENTELNKAFQAGTALLDSAVVAAGATEAAPGDVETEPAKRGRKKNQPDPAAAQAPPPAPIPGAAAPAAPPAPAAPLTIPNDGSIPPFLDRTTTAAAAPPPPPLLPAAPPVAPAAPPVSGPVGAKIIEIITAKTAGAADCGQSYADWLATAGVTIKGATLAEALSVLRMTTDEKLAGVATALGVTA